MFPNRHRHRRASAADPSGGMATSEAIGANEEEAPKLMHQKGGGFLESLLGSAGELRAEDCDRRCRAMKRAQLTLQAAKHKRDLERRQDPFAARRERPSLDPAVVSTGRPGGPSWFVPSEAEDNERARGKEESDAAAAKAAKEAEVGRTTARATATATAGGRGASSIGRTSVRGTFRRLQKQRKLK